MADTIPMRDMIAAQMKDAMKTGQKVRVARDRLITGWPLGKGNARSRRAAPARSSSLGPMTRAY